MECASLLLVSLFIWLSFFTLYIYSFMTLGSSKKRNLFLVPHVYFFQGRCNLGLGWHTGKLEVVEA